jgi:hypothetical protein
VAAMRRVERATEETDSQSRDMRRKTGSRHGARSSSSRQSFWSVGQVNASRRTGAALP